MKQNGHLSYPLMETAANRLHAASGRALTKVNLAAAAAGELSAADIGISADTLRAQADIARAAGYRELAANLQRAAELTAVPNEELLRMYEILRPGRSTYTELTALADTLVNQYNAEETAKFVREAAEVYQARGLLHR